MAANSEDSSGRVVGALIWYVVILVSAREEGLARQTSIIIVHNC